jgi:flagellar basal body rod protein FlgG
MDPVTAASASGLRSRIEVLEMLANNLANSVTTGFKSDRESYGRHFGVDDSAADLDEDAMATLPMVDRQWTDFSQGTLQVTNSGLDLALSGRGFFAVNGPAGMLYTRNGAFRVSAGRLLTTAEGYAVRNSDGQPIRLSSPDPVTISKDGTIEQNGLRLGKLAVVDFADTSALVKHQGTYFTLRKPDVPAVASSAEVHQGKLENSNVVAAESAVRLVSVMRQFEMLQKALSLAGEMSKRVSEEVARVG